MPEPDEQPTEPTEPPDKAQSGQHTAAEQQLTTASGPGRVLVAVYAIFAVASTSRAGLQIATRFDEAPVPYALSALAAVVYVLATVAMANRGAAWWRVAVVAVAFELTGVLVVGTISMAMPGAFPDATVWSNYGMGYVFIPLALPVFGLLWLRRTAPRQAAPGKVTSKVTRTPRHPR